jgi:hypothetical protein
LIFGFRTALACAVAANRLDMVSVLVGSGAEIDVPDARGRTALFAAVRHGNVEIIELLILAKADVNAVDAEGQTPIFEAVFGENVQMIELLVGKGAKVEVGDKNVSGGFSMFVLEEADTAFLRGAAEGRLHGRFAQAEGSSRIDSEINLDSQSLGQFLLFLAQYAL